MVARLIQALDIQEDDHVLLVGAGSGYSAALCSMLARTVVCQDTSQFALDRAEKNCASAGIDNIGFQKVEGLHSLADDVQYDAILVREAMTELPGFCPKRLAENGRCVALIGRDHVRELICCTRDGENIKQESIIDILKPVPERSTDSAQLKGGFVF